MQTKSTFYIVLVERFGYASEVSVNFELHLAYTLSSNVLGRTNEVTLLQAVRCGFQNDRYVYR